MYSSSMEDNLLHANRIDEVLPDILLDIKDNNNENNFLTHQNAIISSEQTEYDKGKRAFMADYADGILMS